MSISSVLKTDEKSCQTLKECCDCRSNHTSVCCSQMTQGNCLLLQSTSVYPLQVPIPRANEIYIKDTKKFMHICSRIEVCFFCCCFLILFLFCRTQVFHSWYWNGINLTVCHGWGSNCMGGPAEPCKRPVGWQARKPLIPPCIPVSSGSNPFSSGSSVVSFPWGQVMRG